MKIQKMQVLLLSITTMIFISCGDAEIIYQQRIAVVGDSISEGWNPDYSRTAASYGWVEMLNGDGGGSYPAPQIETVHTLWNPTLVSNFSKGGSKASEWNSASWLNPVVDFNPDIVIVYLGGNDMLAYIQDGEVSETEYKALETNLSQITGFLSDRLPDASIIMIDYYDLFDGFSLSLETEFEGAFDAYMPVSAATLEGNSIIETIATAAGYTYCTVYAGFMHHCYGRDIGGGGEAEIPQYVMELDYPSMFPIDIHPNTHGHKAIYEQVYATLAALQAGE
jgi:lysophospholipase L1-like esterase